MRSEFCRVILVDTSYVLASNKVLYKLARVNPDKPILVVQFDSGYPGQAKFVNW